MKPLNTYILENYISNIFESFNEPKVSECSFLETVENNDYNYNLYVTPHGHKRSHRSLDTFDSISNDYTNNDIKRITRKCYEQIINKFEDPNTSLTIGTAYSCIWVQTKNIIKDGKKLNLLYYIKSKKYDVNDDKLTYDICVHNGLLSNSIYGLNNDTKTTEIIYLKEDQKIIVNFIVI